MRTTLALYDESVAAAHQGAGVTETSAFPRKVSKALIGREAAARPMELGGSDPAAKALPRRRARPA